MSGIEVSGLSHRYGETQALSDVHFTIPPGQICGLLGPNGAGKTTALSAITGTLRPDAGVIRLGGFGPQEGLQARQLLGYVPDSGGLYGLLSPREHLLLASDLHELDPTVAAGTMARLVEQFGIGAILDQRIDTLSKGQRQRTAICCALLHEPSILLLDEPLNGLDVDAARMLRDVIRAAADNGAAVLYCSHILDVVERLCDRAIILMAGKVLADAPTSELVAKSADSTLESVFHALTHSGDVKELSGAFDA
jgi:ABC-2 type transport system ATP-binding protein